MYLPIYLDHQATTPVDPRVLEAMLPFFTQEFGNPSSGTHGFGRRAAEAVEEARASLAAGLGARQDQIVFTSGATEADNLAILGGAAARRERGRHLVISPLEHKAVLDPAHVLERQGFRVTWLEPDRFGRIGANAVEKALEPDTILVSVMHANNEIGSVSPLAEIGRRLRGRGILFHTDAAQSAGKLPLDVEAMELDLVSLTAHKIYGPKGAGALYVRDRSSVVPVMHGGGQEGALRPGTVGVPLVVGLARALELAWEHQEEERSRLRELSDRLESRLRERIPDLRLNGHPRERIPGNLHLSFPGVDAGALLLALPEVALSAGAACYSTDGEVSPVLAALGLTAEEARGSVRFGLGRSTREDEIDYVVERICGVVRHLRDGSGRSGQSGDRKVS